MQVIPKHKGTVDWELLFLKVIFIVIAIPALVIIVSGFWYMAYQTIVTITEGIE